jgi:carbonic anhydrase
VCRFGNQAVANNMNTIDYIFRFDPRNQGVKPGPSDPASARKALEAGNRMFASWMESCRSSDMSGGGAEYVVPTNGVHLGLTGSKRELPKQAPFAVVVGCSDARVPTELLFGQGFNDLFIVRVAGNVLGDVCMGSVDYALHGLAESVRCLVVLGHLGCGAVTATVDAYLEPHDLWAKGSSPALRSIVQRIFVAVCEADHGLRHVWGIRAPEVPEYRQTLIDIAVCVNAAQAAYDLRREVERAGTRNLEVFYGVFNTLTHQVAMPVDPRVGYSPEAVNLAPAPTSPTQFHDLASRMAETLKPKSLSAGKAHSHAGERTSSTAGKWSAKTDSLILEGDDHLGTERHV